MSSDTIVWEKHSENAENKKPSKYLFLVKSNSNLTLKIKSHVLVPLYHYKIRFEILPAEGLHRKTKKMEVWERP